MDGNERCSEWNDKFNLISQRRRASLFDYKHKLVVSFLPFSPRHKSNGNRSKSHFSEKGGRYVESWSSTWNRLYVKNFYVNNWVTWEKKTWKKREKIFFFTFFTWLFLTCIRGKREIWKFFSRKKREKNYVELTSREKILREKKTWKIRSREKQWRRYVKNFFHVFSRDFFSTCSRENLG